MRLRAAVFVPLLIGTSLAASAQDFSDSKSFSVNASFNLQLPLENGAQTADVAKAIAQITQQLGDLANRECDVLAGAFKADCHVSQLNFGTNVNERRNRRFNNEGGEPDKVVSASVQATFALTPKSAAPKPEPTSTP